MKEYFKLKANETIKDQFDVIRIIKGNTYSLVDETDEYFTVIDETGKEIDVDRFRTFCESEE